VRSWCGDDCEDDLSQGVLHSSFVLNLEDVDGQDDSNFDLQGLICHHQGIFYHYQGGFHYNQGLHDGSYEHCCWWRYHHSPSVVCASSSP
jgi:hypothetical protein